MRVHAKMITRTTTCVYAYIQVICLCIIYYVCVCIHASHLRKYSSVISVVYTAHFMCVYVHIIYMHIYIYIYAAARFVQDDVDRGLPIHTLYEQKVAGQALDLPDLPLYHVPS
jgi:hypothetical protein